MMNACINVMHNEVDCSAAGIPKSEWCEPCLVLDQENAAPIHVAGTVHTPIVIDKVKRGVITITCPGCNGFEFERTSVGHARSWATEHNNKSHGGAFGIEDRTQGGS